MSEKPMAKRIQKLEKALEIQQEDNVVPLKPVMALATSDGEPPDGRGNWLQRQPVGTTFFTTKKTMLDQPDLMKATVIGRKGRVTVLSVDIPSNPMLTLYVYTEAYSFRYELVEVW